MIETFDILSDKDYFYQLDNDDTVTYFEIDEVLGMSEQGREPYGLYLTPRHKSGHIMNRDLFNKETERGSLFFATLDSLLKYSKERDLDRLEKKTEEYLSEGRFLTHMLQKAYDAEEDEITRRAIRVAMSNHFPLVEFKEE